MRVSTNGRYSLRIMLDLALNAGEGIVRREDITSRQGISPDHIAQLFRRLSKAGLAESVMGPGGGYRLGRFPAHIRIGEIFEATEGTVTTVDCISPDSGEGCGRVQSCAAHLLWVSLSQVIKNHLDKITLQNLCDIACQLEGTDQQGCQKTVDNILSMMEHLPTIPPDCDYTQPMVEPELG
jgi:Rrf2 family protein